MGKKVVRHRGESSRELHVHTTVSLRVVTKATWNGCKHAQRRVLPVKATQPKCEHAFEQIVLSSNMANGNLCACTEAKLNLISIALAVDFIVHSILKMHFQFVTLKWPWHLKAGNLQSLFNSSCTQSLNDLVAKHVVFKSRPDGWTNTRTQMNNRTAANYLLNFLQTQITDRQTNNQTDRLSDRSVKFCLSFCLFNINLCLYIFYKCPYT